MAGGATRRLPQRAAKIRGSSVVAPVRATTRRAGRLASTRISKIRFPDSDSDSDPEPDSEDDADRSFPQNAQPRRSSRRILKRPSLADESPDPLVLDHGSKRPRRRPPHATLDADDKVDTDESPSRLQKYKSHEQYEAPVVPWPTLPYYVLVEIFRFALTSMGHDDKNTVRWLLQTSRLCRAFAEPALTALYEQPPLLSFSMLHGLAGILAKDPTTTTYQYRLKVKKLLIDVDLIGMTSKRRRLNLERLVRSVPHLEVLDFYHPSDGPPFRQCDQKLRWKYQSSLFEALNSMSPEDIQSDVLDFFDRASIAGADQDATSAASRCQSLVDNAGEAGVAPGSSHNSISAEARPTGSGTFTKAAVQLRAWRWNRRMIESGLEFDANRLRYIHRTGAFSGLKKISLVNFQPPFIGKDEADLSANNDRYVQSLANSIGSLPELEHLVFEYSGVVSGELLALLPRNLKGLTLINCWAVKADDLANFLLSHGRNLRDLVLHHNTALSLAFLPVLGSSCPRLRTLDMDMKVFSLLDSYDDPNLTYDTLLHPDQVPTWPAQIETIKLKNMSQWHHDQEIQEETVHMFFHSLVDNAVNFLNLRVLFLKMMLNKIPVFDRGKIREHWVPRLRKIFLRKSEDPRPVHSLRQASENDMPVNAENDGLSKKRRPVGYSASRTPKRRSTRIATQTVVGPDNESDNFPSSPGLTGKEAFIQGLCEVVDIQIDSGKPTEFVKSMDDFLDSESDDPTDDDWTGDPGDDDVYAW